MVLVSTVNFTVLSEPTVNITVLYVVGIKFPGKGRYVTLESPHIGTDYNVSSDLAGRCHRADGRASLPETTSPPAADQGRGREAESVQRQDYPQVHRRGGVQDLRTLGEEG